MASKFFSGLWTSLTNVASGSKKVLQQLFGAVQEGKIVQPPEADTLFFPHQTDWIPEFLATISQGYDINEPERIFEHSHKPSIGRDVDDEASENAMDAVQPSPQEDRNDPSDLSQVKNVVLSSADQFTKFDTQLIIIHLEENSDGILSEASQRQIECCAEEIQTIRRGDGQTQSWSNEETRCIAHKTLEASENCGNSVLRTEIGGSLESEFSTDNSVEFRLHGGELLKPKTRKCLEAMFTAFALQLSCCNVNHFMRLKLTGFVDQVNHEKPTFFDLYLSSGHDCTRSYWVESKCTFTRLVCYSAGNMRIELTDCIGNGLKEKLQAVL